LKVKTFKGITENYLLLRPALAVINNVLNCMTNWT